MRKSNNIIIIFSCIFTLLGMFFLFFPKGGDSLTEQNQNILDIVKNTISRSEAKNSVYLVAGGDIMLSRNIGYFAKRDGYDRVFKSGNYNPVTSFENCTGDDCLLFFNLESLFNENDHDIQKGGFDFRANPKNVETLLQLRQDHDMVLSLANNHTINARYSGVVQTKEILDENSIMWAGVGISTGESRKFVVYEKNGIKLCLGAYSYDGQFVKVGGGKISRNKTDEKIIKEDLLLMNETGCDVKILSLHRGAEYSISPNKQQQKLAYSLIDSGADLILGGHSHVPGEYEIYSGKYIFYSFGNFIFDQGWGKWSQLPYNRIFDYALNKRTIPTYIGLLAGINIQKFDTGINIDLDKIVMTTVTDGIPSPLDAETYSGIMARIDKINN